MLPKASHIKGARSESRMPGRARFARHHPIEGCLLRGTDSSEGDIEECD